ncbi:MAG TPA: hypothetical protein ENI07_00375 [Desulfobacterales bacterium]|nr:hypothetical protein [Desulfobacterales bacterium]
METSQLEILERIARFLPVRKIFLGYEGNGINKVYMAWGKNSLGEYIGLWGCHGVARTLEFKKGTPLKKVKFALSIDADSFIEELYKKDLLCDQQEKMIG